MTRRKKISLTATAYFLNIVLFTLIYWIAWTNNPSNFIVNEQYDEQTVKPFFGYDDLPDTNLTSQKMMTARAANDLIKPYYDTLSTITINQKSVDKLLLENMVLDSINNERLMKSFEENFNIYLKKLLTPYNKTKDSIETAIHDFEKSKDNSVPNSSSFYQYDLAIAKLNLALSKNELAGSKTKYYAYNKSIKSITTFYNDTLYHKAKFLYARIDTLEKKKGYLLEEILDKKEKISLIAIDYYMNRVNKLGFTDFLYFSIITASSTGYGDILPNNSIIRIFVSIEILFSLFLFGFFFYFISQSAIYKKTNGSNV